MPEIKTIKCDEMGDWYTVEKAEHGNVETLVPYDKNGSFLYYSGRISDACVEGPASAMIAMARAVLANGSYREKRAAVKVDEDDHVALFWSPRNSQMRGEGGLDYAKHWATETLEMLGTEEDGS